ncbi:DNA helicase HerA-like ATPase [Dysgonomonas sp. PFB1-18]|uniref:helicase HerA-like domain-containing protein n=1 Tax=unclassified Dysgonomonas TaxID=2630389 RepID=UPI00247385AF|nr:MULTISPECIES: helicase HerA-like domain-containing protein [unclassified Dysgonomonas]MDH6308589.1 DNA helicase HerA-like ATPase [Dysgonomonas sp. PF1-14]MDH6338090.1 DNA helicase HerA-like ATPase [Dysgonomonas sp. PF1-16]MDH6379587.1 DNA helicase HerA-like ATPase [Dysgonomonas sp. PFB1-18]MDH6396917.1 DNA helicase HerA-like ATPase [Dysgonomonas sp. PF1-23]
MFDNEKRAFVAISQDAEVCIFPKMANRHGLITGATGTGKTVTLQTMAETFSSMGVPVFAADVKGDLSGVAAIGGNKESVTQRVESYHLADKGFKFQAFPVQFWDVFGEQGTPIRATVADMGPLLLSRLLSLNDTQSAVLTIIFKIAKDESLEIIDLKDLQKLLEYVGNNAAKFTTGYGNISTASIGAIQRGLITLEHDGADQFFGEPNLNIDDLIQTVGDKGVINILASDKLMNSPRVYTTFLMWLMTKLFDVMPEVGDPDKPKMVFFLDEAHLLFNDAQKALLEKIEQVVRLIRSKGIGIYFISQTPADIPDSVLGQLGNRVQHALRAYTPKDQKAVKVAAQTFRANPAFDTETVISELGTGEALVSFLDEKGRPNQVERAYILPPEGQIGPLDQDARKKMTESSILYRHYSQVQDRESAYEKLTERMQGTLSEKEQAAQAKAEALAQKEAEKARKEQERAQREQEKLDQKKSAENKRFWSKMTSTVIAPIAKQLVNAFLKKK